MDAEEKLLVGIVLSTSVAMIVGSFQYVPDSRPFPQAAAILTILFGALVVLNNRADLLSESDTDIIGQVNEKAALDDQLHGTPDDGSAGPQIGTAEPGTFRIDQPLLEYTVPFTDYTVTHRATLAVMLVLYLGAVWLLGVFLSSLGFLLLYGKVLGLRRNVMIGLTVFTICALFVFGLWLETPLFRPGHDISIGGL